MNVEKSLLDRNQSTWLKGFLILLIILGHNSILMGNLPGMRTTAVYDFLYCFHVYAFFFVTSLYNWPNLSKKYIKKIFLRLYKPYTIMFVLVFLANLLFIKKVDTNWGGVIISYLSGSDFLIKKSIGMSFVWFLPTMFSFLLILGSCRNESLKYLRFLLLALSIGLLVLSSCGFLKYEDNKWSISGSWVALRTFAVCYLNRQVFEKFGERKIYRYLVYGVVIMITIVFFSMYGRYHMLDSLLTYILVPSAMFQFLVVLVYQKKHYSGALLYLGRHSLQIYLFHQLIYNSILIGLNAMLITPNMMIGVLTYISTLAITIIFDILFRKSLPAIYNFMYSRNA